MVPGTWTTMATGSGIPNPVMSHSGSEQTETNLWQPNGADITPSFYSRLRLICAYFKEVKS